MYNFLCIFLGLDLIMLFYLFVGKHILRKFRKWSDDEES